MPGRIEQQLKSYFYFNRSERKGIWVLLCILIAFMIAPTIYSKFFNPPDFQFSLTDLPLDTMPDRVVKAISSTINHPVLKPFDPNVLAYNDWLKLGVPAKTVSVILRYRKAGGKFNKAEDILRIYGMNENKARELIPFVSIDPQKTASNASDSSKWKSRVTEKKEFVVLELNGADSISLVKLYRIGPALSHRIIEYRNKLGGFIDLNQLTEIWGFDEDYLYDLKGKIRVDEQISHKMNINQVEVQELSLHPYFKYKLSNAIVNYRKQHGPFRDLNQLKNIVLINDSVFLRISRYLVID